MCCLRQNVNKNIGNMTMESAIAHPYGVKNRITVFKTFNVSSLFFVLLHEVEIILMPLDRRSAERS